MTGLFLSEPPARIPKASEFLKNATWYASRMPACSVTVQNRRLFVKGPFPDVRHVQSAAMSDLLKSSLDTVHLNSCGCSVLYLASEAKTADAFLCAANLDPAPPSTTRRPDPAMFREQDDHFRLSFFCTLAYRYCMMLEGSLSKRLIAIPGRRWKVYSTDEFAIFVGSNASPSALPPEDAGEWTDTLAAHADRTEVWNELQGILRSWHDLLGRKSAATVYLKEASRETDLLNAFLDRLRELLGDRSCAETRSAWGF
jgi:hypothetical protein